MGLLSEPDRQLDIMFFWYFSYVSLFEGELKQIWFWVTDLHHAQHYPGIIIAIDTPFTFIPFLLGIRVYRTIKN